MTGAGLYRLSTTAIAIPSQTFIAGNYGSCGVNSKGQIYLGVTNYSDESKNAVKIFDATGKEIKSFATGFGPNAFVF
jgi:hypothetical protein